MASSRRPEFAAMWIGRPLPALILAVTLSFLAGTCAHVFAQTLERSFGGDSVPLPGFLDVSGSRGYDLILDPDEPWFGTNPEQIRVTNADELRRALASAKPGQVITLADGVYDGGGPFVAKDVRGGSAPFVIRAENRGRAVIAGRSWILVENSENVIIDGLKFTTTDETTSHAVRFNNVTTGRITHNHFALIESASGTTSRHWVYISGSNSRDIRIDFNLFEGKRRIGNFISIAGDGVQVAQRIRIDRNHFRDMTPTGANGMEAIRIGVSDLARSYSNSRIEYNLFERCNGDAEIISIKSGGNVVRYNTFLESEGAVTFRHGNDGSAYGNYFIGNGKPGTGGIRVYGRRYLVYNNHFEGLGGTGTRSALTIGAGDVKDQETVLNYWPAEHVLVAHNTFVNNRSSINIASGPYAPRDIVFLNNVIYSDEPGTLIFEDAKAEVAWAGNLAFAAGRATLGVRKGPDEIRIADPQLVPGVGGVHVIGEQSPAVDAALWSPTADGVLAAFEATSSDAFRDMSDIEGKPRSDPFDAGAFEHAGWPLLRGPLTAEEVGPWARPATRFSLDAPGVYVTDVRFRGESDEQSSWWGPISVDVMVGVTPRATDPAAGAEPDLPVAVSAFVDGVEVFRGEAPAAGVSFAVNRGELSDGDHVLTVVAERGELKDQVSSRFTVSNVRIASPAPSAAVRGVLPIEASLGLPADALREVRVMLDDALIYSGAGLPPDLVLDTLAHADGPHRLTIEAAGKAGARAARSVAFLVDNFWEKSDPLPPPVNWGALGLLERTQTSAKSSGWVHVRDSQGDFGGDGDRMAVQGDAAEYLIWETPGLTKAQVVVFAKDPAIDGKVIFSSSADGFSWQPLPWRIESSGRLDSGWHRLELIAELPGESEQNYFRLTLNPDAGAAPGDIQLGHVSLWGRHPR